MWVIEYERKAVKFIIFDVYDETDEFRLCPNPGIVNFWMMDRITYKLDLQKEKRSAEAPPKAEG